VPALVGGSFVLFVAGEPDTGADPFKDVQTSIVRRLAGVVVGGAVVGGHGKRKKREADERAASQGLPPWILPREQQQCIELVEDAAQELQRSVTLVDVNRPEGNQSLVDRWFTPDSILPLLVSPSGERLEGNERFTPTTIRRFLRDR
jgi:hypothetical protein